METIITIAFSPVFAFIVAFAAIALFSAFVGRFIAAKPVYEEGKTEPYACGENISHEKAEPNYKQFFPFAIFFTVLHVAGLMLATSAGIIDVQILKFVLFYVFGVVMSLLILFIGR